MLQSFDLMFVCLAFFLEPPSSFKVELAFCGFTDWHARNVEWHGAEQTAVSPKTASTQQRPFRRTLAAEHMNKSKAARSHAPQNTDTGIWPPIIGICAGGSFGTPLDVDNEISLKSGEALPTATSHPCSFECCC